MLTICDIVFRVLAVLLCLAAAVVVGVDKKTEEVGFGIFPGFPGVPFELPAKWHYLSALVYFLVANTIASGYAIISSIVVLINRGRNKVIAAVVIFFDVVVVGVLLSSLGATVAVGLIAYKGIDRLGWAAVCGTFGQFCHQAAAAMGLSASGCAAFLLVVLFGVFNLRKNVIAI